MLPEVVAEGDWWTMVVFCAKGSQLGRFLIPTQWFYFDTHLSQHHEESTTREDLRICRG